MLDVGRARTSAHVVHVNVFLKDMADFEAMNRAYAAAMGEHRPARTAIGVARAAQAGRAADDEPHRGHAGVTGP